MSKTYRNGLKEKRSKKSRIKIGDNWYDDLNYGCWLNKRSVLDKISKKEMKEAKREYEIEKIIKGE